MRCRVSTLLLAAFFVAINATAMALEPGKSGDVYREFSVYATGNDWRVTDPNATAPGAKDFLPNPVLRLEIDDLDNALRAEAIIERWGGHPRTTDKRVRFNGSDWIAVPEIETTPEGTRPEEYYSMDNPVVPVPLDDLRTGINTIEGTCGVLDGYDWGQWGMYSVTVRVYYDPKMLSHAVGQIIEPVGGAALSEQPRIRVNATGDVARIELFASYDGYDEDGDGRHDGWHGAQFQSELGQPAPVTSHVGTLSGEPYTLNWDTTWVPDQAPGSVKLIARVQNVSGVWSVTPAIANLTFERQGTSVRLIKPEFVDVYLGVRAGEEKTTAIEVPTDLVENATQAKLALRTWHGWDEHHEPLRFNGQTMPIRGRDHFYDFDLLDIPVEWLRPGANELTIRSETTHHMLEVLWPGPALLVRTETDAAHGPD